MSVKVSIEHRTEYAFDRPAELGPHEIRLRPAPHATTPIDAYSLTVTPAEHSVSWRQDAFGNHVARVSFPKQVTATALTFEVGLVAELAPNNPFDFFVREDAERWPFHYARSRRAETWRRSSETPPSHRRRCSRQRIEAIGRESMRDGRVPRRAQRDPRRADRVHDPRRARRPDTRADARSSHGLLSRQLVAAGRAAARPWSGRPLHVRLSRPARAQARRSDTIDLHAWAEAYIPGAGWVGMDPTSGLLTGEGHIPLASASTPAGAAPVIGSVSDVGSELVHRMASRGSASGRAPSAPTRSASGG